MKPYPGEMANLADPRPMPEDARVDFIIAGVQKAGTTALFDHLSELPDLALSDVKETHFFDDESQDWSDPDYDAYHRRFPAPDGRLRGEATPIYTYWPGALERIATYRPDIRLIVMLRDPVERAWSHWRMERSRGAETEPFGWCIRQGRQRLFSATPWGHHREFSYVERGFYAEQAARMFELFPRSQVLIVQAEHLRSDPEETLGRLCAFLGLPAPGPVRRREIHVGPEMEGLDPRDADYLRGLYARDQARLAELLA